MTDTSQHTDPNAELLRLQYLQLLGITSYYPRLILPGAGPSRACDWPEPEAPRAAETPPAVESVPPASAPPPVDPAPARPRVAPGLSARLESGQDIDSVAPPPRSGAPVAPAVSRPEPGRELRFQLLLLPAGRGLAVCNRIPALARPELGAPEARLLHNILAWLDSPLRGDIAPRHFLWPLPGLSATNPEQAGQGLFGFLQQAQTELGFRELLLMGCSEESMEPVLPVLRRGLEANAGWRQYETHSLSELLALPELKREAWKRMQPLHAELSRQGG